MSSKLNDLVQAHLAIVALLESPLISPTSRAQLETFREQLERDIALAKDAEPEEIGTS